MTPFIGGALAVGAGAALDVLHLLLGVGGVLPGQLRIVGVSGFLASLPWQATQVFSW
jgi:hypothetical protein